MGQEKGWKENLQSPRNEEKMCKKISLSHLAASKTHTVGRNSRSHSATGENYGGGKVQYGHKADRGADGEG